MGGERTFLREPHTDAGSFISNLAQAIEKRTAACVSKPGKGFTVPKCKHDFSRPTRTAALYADKRTLVQADS